MPITITKPKETTKVKSVEVELPKEKTLDEMSDEELADHYGALHDQTNAIMESPAFHHFDLAAKELAKRIKAQVEPSDGAELSGAKFTLEIGACAKKPRQVSNMPLLASLLGTKFVELASVRLSDVDKYLTPEQQVQVVNSDTGYGESRKIIVKYHGN